MNLDLDRLRAEELQRIAMPIHHDQDALRLQSAPLGNVARIDRWHAVTDWPDGMGAGMNCCTDYGVCNQGRDCPARAKRCHDLPAPTAPLSDCEPSGGTVALVLAVVAVVWLVAFSIAPFLAGWWHP